MNIIGNSCASCFLQTQFFNHAILNPFSYNIIDFESFSYLVNHFDEINFENISFHLSNDYVVGLLENKICINFVHYKFDEKAKTIEYDKNNDVRYDKILEYVKEKWHERAKRIKESEPIFLAAAFNSNNMNCFNENQIYSLLNSKSKYKIIIAYEKDIDWTNTDRREFIRIDRSNIKTRCTDGRPLANYLIANSKIINPNRIDFKVT